MQLLDQLLLVLGQNAGAHIVDAQLTRDSLGRSLVVAGGHDDRQTERVQIADRPFGALLDRIGHGDDPRERPIDGNEHRRLAIRAERVGPRLGFAGLEPEIPHHRRIAERHVASVDGAAHALAGDRFEIGRAAGRQTAIPRARDDRLGQRMFRATFQSGGAAQHLRLVALQRHDIRQRRLALGQRAGLVHDHGIDARHALQRLGVLDQHARLCAAPRGRGDRDRRREAEGTGTGDDQDGDGRGDGECQRRLGTEGKPGEERRDGHRDDRRYEDGRDPVRQPLDRRARASGTGHHVHDLRQHRVGANLRRPDRERTVLVDRAARDTVAFCLFDGHGLAGDHAFVNGRVALDHFAIDRHAVAGAHPQQVALHDVLERCIIFASVGKNSPRGLGRKVHQRADRVAGAFPRAKLQHLAHEDQRNDDDGGLEIRADAFAHPILLREQPRREGGDQRIRIGRADPERDQRPHVRGQAPEGVDAAPEERKRCPEDNGRGEDEFDVNRQLVAQPVANRQADQLAHRQDHEGHGRGRADPHPAGEVGQFLAGLVRGHHRLQRHAADRTASGFVADNLGVHRAGVLRAGLGFLRCLLRVSRRVEIRIHTEFRLAAFRAEPVGLAAILARPRVLAHLDLHAADGIRRGFRAGGRSVVAVVMVVVGHRLSLFLHIPLT